jgi:Helix-turn-helix domain
VELLKRYSKNDRDLAKVRNLLDQASDPPKRNLGGDAPAWPPKRVQRRLDVEDVERLVASYRDGGTVPELAVQFGIHRTTVLEHLKRAGVPRRPHVRKLSDQDVAVAAEHYRAGESLATVGRRFGVDAMTVAREFQRAGVETRARRGYGLPMRPRLVT